MRSLLLLTSLSVVVVPLPVLARPCPKVLFVVDRSGSMGFDPTGGGGQSKWELAKLGVAAALEAYGDRLQFGLQAYSVVNGGPACYNETRIDVLPGWGTANAINQTLGRLSPLVNTNTGEAIRRAYNDGQLNDKTRGNYIVLITDGDPNCNPSDSGTLATYTLGELTAAAAKDPPIHTFVIGFDGSGGVKPANLNAMAMAGGEPRAGCNPDAKSPVKPCYYSASSVQQFLDAMETIIGGLAGTTVVGSCDDTCWGNGCPEGQRCAIPDVGRPPVCQLDACLGVTCEGHKFCQEGACKDPCAECPSGMLCRVDDQGIASCQADHCRGRTCDAGFWCDVTGSCVADRCAAVKPSKCPLPTYCNPATGECMDDPCRTISCPLNATCITTTNAMPTGWCQFDPPRVEVDMAVRGAGADMAVDELDGGVVGRPRPGCSVGAGAGAGGTTGGGSLVAGLLACCALRLRRSGRRPRRQG